MKLIQIVFLFITVLITPSLFAINLSTIGSVTTSNTPGAVAVSQDGQHLYTSDLVNKLNWYNRNSDGTFSYQGNLATPNAGFGMAFSPDGKLLYVSGFQFLSWYLVNADGSLGPLGGTISVPNEPNGLVVSADDKYLYASDANKTVEWFTINQNGSINPLQPQNHSAQLSGLGKGITMSPDGKNLYAVCSDNAIDRLHIGSNGVAVYSGGQDRIALDGNPMGIAASPSGDYLYVITSKSNNPGSNSLEWFNLNADGSISYQDKLSRTDLDVLIGLTISADGNNVYFGSFSRIVNLYSVTMINFSDPDPNSYDYINSLVEVPVGKFGLKNYVVTNTGNSTIRLTSFPALTGAFSYDKYRSTCDYTSSQSTVLLPSQSCNIVIKYQPTNYSENGNLDFSISGNNQVSKFSVLSTSLSIPYSSRAQ